MRGSRHRMARANGPFAHVTQKFRGKIARDFLDRVTPDNQWDMDRFDSANDYQRHLYGLFLRLSGRTLVQVWAAIYTLSEDVPVSQRQRYTDDVVHSEIVGFPSEDGTLLTIPNNQQVVEYPAGQVGVEV